ncbi:ricin-type beta-trefoil lectin domain protein [Streptomyces sp. NPDC096198]|uniref:ricin-type beta-trefoil lectin domain protein n=1 Tax=Streptomyces sp. NPDC096198 TaxID=3366080 RepID=UPI003804CF97
MLASPAAAAAAVRPLCLDVGTTRNNGDPVRLANCLTGWRSQSFVLRDGQIKVEDTVGTAREMCLDIGDTRNNGDPLYLWQCIPGLSNQTYIQQRGEIKAEDTFGTAREMCLYLRHRTGDVPRRRQHPRPR